MKTATLIAFLLVVSISPTASAEVFKCQLASGKTVYQEQPCTLNTDKAVVKQAVVELEKPDPAKEAERERQFNEWKKGYETREAEERKAAQERQAEVERLERIEALNRNAIANQELADAVKDAGNRPNIINHNYQPYGYRPYRPYYPPRPVPHNPPPAPQRHYPPLSAR
ncbi:hypothetical protein JCM14076_04620 [Methylosoma difficile]